MRDRHIFWDVAPFGLLFIIAVALVFVVVDNERKWNRLNETDKNHSKLTIQNQKILRALSDGEDESTKALLNAMAVQADQNEKILKRLAEGMISHSSTTPANTTQPNPDTLTKPPVAKPDVKPDVTPRVVRPRGMEHIPAHVKIPEKLKFVRGDENADDGDWLVRTLGSEPNSLNPLRDNDSITSAFFGLANDNLAERCFDDLAIWEPRLARAWTQELVCLAYVKDGKAAELAQEIEKTWSAEIKKNLQIKRISADSPDVLRLEISDVNNDYREQLEKDFGSKIEKQWWLYISYQGQNFLDQTPITPKAMEAKLTAGLKNSPNFKGKLIAGWAMEDKIILRVLGDEHVREAAEKILQELVASPDNKALFTDIKAANASTEKKCFTYDLYEDYLAQEKPVFTFYLRKDVKWHDDEPFSGKDVIFTYQTMMNPKIECDHIRNYYNDCEKFELVDDNPYIVRVTWIRPYFDAFTFSAGLNILPEHLFKFDNPKDFNEGKQNQELVGNGPYKLESWERGQSFVFVRNEAYYAKSSHYSKMVYRIVKDPNAALQMFENKDTDIFNLRPSQMKLKEKDEEFLSKFNINRSTDNVYRYVGWNARKELFNDKRVRQALTMLIDRDRICKDVMRGYAKPMHGTVHPDNPAFWKELPSCAWPFDPERAKKLLSEAGWRDSDNDGVLDRNGVPFKFTLIITSNSPEYESMANIIKDSFSTVGIVVNISNLEWSVLLQQVERLQFDAVILGWQLGLAEDPYQLWHSSQTKEKGSNHCAFVNKEADRIIVNCRRELNETKRFKMLKRFQEIILDEQPYTFLFVPDRLVAYDKRIRNVNYKLVGPDTSRWWVPTAEQKPRK